MQDVEKKYLNQGVNADDEFNSLKPGEIISSVNARFGSTESGATARWENLPSNQELVNSYLPGSGTNIEIGKISSDDGRYIVFFNYNSLGTHGVFLYYKPTSTFYKVLLNTSVTGGLNFSKDNLITGRVVNGLLIWTDGLNEPRYLNLAASIKGNHAGSSPISSIWQFAFPIAANEITLIRKPLAFPPSISKQANGAVVSNNIKNESFQFAAYMVGFDGEVSVLNGWSHASFLNKESDTYNFIRVTLSTADQIPQSVRIVRLVVRIGSSGKTFVVKDWDKLQDSTPITAHNAGSGLSFDFYNNISGEGLADAFATKPFESVALLARTLETAKNRVFLGYLTKGYDTPLSTSLNITGTTSINTSQSVEILDYQIVAYDTGTGPPPVVTWQYTSLIVNLPMAAVPGYYEITIPNTVIINSGGPPSYYTPAPSTVNFLTDLTYMGSNLAAASAARVPSGKTLLQYVPHTTGTTVTVTNLPSNGSKIFKSGSGLQLGIVFFDQYLRKCGVLTLDSLKFKVDDRNYAATNAVTGINWALSNTGALSEIPLWAYYYAIVRTDNLRTRSFIENLSDKFFYAKKDSAGAWDFTDTTYSSVATRAIAIDTAGLEQSGMGYTFSEGDVCILTASGSQYTLPVIGQSGKYILVSPKDIGSLLTAVMIYEIYTPYLPSTQEPFYECGEMFAIVNPAGSSRSYSTLSGTLSGDLFLVTRSYNSNVYKAEATCPNDRFWQRWDRDDGRQNLITTLGQVVKPTALEFSNTYVPGTLSNGLNNFEALNEEILPIELRQIMSLVNVDKVGDDLEGTVMLAVGSGACRSASIYVGVVQVQNSDSSSYFIKSEGVIGQVNILKGNFGTNNPESIVVFDGGAYWIDTSRGRFVEYSLNGLDEISEGKENAFKFARASLLLSRKFLSTPAATIEGYGSRPFIFGGVDPVHGEIYWTFPKMDTVVPKGQLSDYVSSTPAYVESPDYPYDIVDYKAKTFVYKITDGKWRGFNQWAPEGFTTLDSDTYSFKSGKLYKHNIPGTYNRFYGVVCRTQFITVFNKDNVVKEAESFAIEGSLPEWVHFRAEEPFEQSTDLISSDFTNKEGINYAALYRDRLSPNVSGTTDQKQIKGDKMRTKALLCLIQFGNEDQLKFLRIITLGYNQSTGHY